MKSIVIPPFKDTGVNTIDTELVKSKWNHLWRIHEWRRDNSWRIIKFIRKDSPITDLKITISEKQAKELIVDLFLIDIQGPFTSAHTYMRKQDVT